jgi:ATP/maltotriose-dependent transcriptional regulator MalT
VDIDIIGQNTASPFRLSPPEPNRALVLRPRLLEVLGGRFERRLTVLVGGAGFGKTSLLVQALDQNGLDPQGQDVWLGCTSGDGSAPALSAGLLAALGASVEVAAGDRAAARSVIAAVIDDLRRDGLESEPDTVGLLDRI